MWPFNKDKVSYTGTARDFLTNMERDRREREEKLMSRSIEIDSVLKPFRKEYENNYTLPEEKLARFVDEMTKDQVNCISEEKLDCLVVTLEYNIKCFAKNEDIYPEGMTELLEELSTIKSRLFGGFADIYDKNTFFHTVSKLDIISTFNEAYDNLGFRMVNGLGDSVVIMKKEV